MLYLHLHPDCPPITVQDGSMYVFQGHKGKLLHAVTDCMVMEA
jgi:hypothetical protein